MAAIGAIQSALGLDYAGVDFALAADGRLVVFEANATMTIVTPPDDPIWDYRRPAIQRAIGAVQALISGQAARSWQ
jgi:glutathione synthase/RimK-type ligase-like ATP-grasp enzyme